jgi:hypothetical protein
MDARIGVVVFVSALAGCGGAISTTGEASASGGAAGAGGALSAGGASASGGAPSAGGEGGATGHVPLPATSASVRLAHVDPWLSPLDACIGTQAADGTIAYEPQSLLASAGRPQGLAYTEVSTYVPTLTGRFVRVVAAGTDCSQPSTAPAWQLAPGPPHGHLAPRFTIAPVRAVGEGGALVRTAGFVDEPENDQYGIHVRTLSFVRTAVDADAGPVEVAGVDALGNALTWFPALTYGALSTASPLGMVSPRGFLWRPETEVRDLRITAGEVLVATKGKLAVPSGDGNAYGVASVFLVGSLVASDVRAVACGDNATGTGGLGDCIVLSP